MNNRKSSKPISSINNPPSADPKAGLVLLLTLILVIVTTTLATALLFAARNSTRVVKNWANYDNALWAAQTALEKVKSQIHEGFEAFHKSTYSWNNIYWIEDNASDYSISNITFGALVSNAVVHLDYSNALLSIVVSNGFVTGAFDARSIPITVTATATLGDSTRTIEEVFEYELTRSTVFDHAYFMNNFGWMYGVNLVFNGDVRSNYDYDWRTSRGALNANCFAAGENLISSIPDGYTEAEYIAAGNPFARPLQHPESTNTSFTVSKGYDPTTGGNTVDGATPIKMPYIGEVADIVAYAHHKSGTISQGGAVVVDAFYDGVGPSGIADAPDEGCLVLIGTLADPIVINGPVVIEGDVLIKGYYTGQGTIYAGRNAHILDDVIAINPPQWSPTDIDINWTTFPLTQGTLQLTQKNQQHPLGTTRHRHLMGNRHPLLRMDDPTSARIRTPLRKLPLHPTHRSPMGIRLPRRNHRRLRRRTPTDRMVQTKQRRTPAPRRAQTTQRMGLF